MRFWIFSKNIFIDFSFLEAETGEYPPIPGYLPENFNGWALNLLAFLSNTRLGDFFLNKIILKAIGVEKLRALKLECGPTFFPIWPHGKATAKIGDEPDISGALNAEKSMERSKNKFCYRTAPEYVRAYKEGKLTPVDVAYRIIDVSFPKPNRKLFNFHFLFKLNLSLLKKLMMKCGLYVIGEKNIFWRKRQNRPNDIYLIRHSHH